MLFTDFGLEGPYTGQVQAVLHQAAPEVPVISLFADLPPGQVKPAAYLLAAYATWFPPGTVLLCVVDPGVGSDRPDNGLFEIVLRRAARAEVWQITWRPAAMSASFHGRDLFAPIAVRLATGEAPAAIAAQAHTLRYSEWPDDLAEIVYVDRYGNAMTGLRGQVVATSTRLSIGGKVLAHADTFSAVPRGTAFWYVNSNGLVEIAVNQGRADRELGLAIGATVTLTS